MSNKIHVISVQPYGYIDGHRDRGSGALGSRARLEKGLEIARELTRAGERVLFLFPQGYKKENPTRPGERGLSLGGSMAHYLETRIGEEEHINVYTKPLSWGTANDLRALCLMLAELDVGSIPYVHFVTDPTHLKRVRLIWKHIKHAGYHASFHAATAHRMTWKERWMREPIARLKFRYELLRGR